MLQQTTLRPPVESRADAQIGVHDYSRREQTNAAAEGLSVQLVQGRRAILKMEPELALLARNSSQAGETDNLTYLLSTAYSLKKIPWLLTIASAVRPGSARLADCWARFCYSSTGLASGARGS